MAKLFSPEILQKFILGFSGTELPRELNAHLADGLAGVILYPRNFTGLEGLHELTQQIRRAAGRPVLIGVDQEGGPRFSLPAPFTQWPSAAELGRLNDADLAERMARALARELRAAGFNLNFAPMLDLHVQAESPVTTDRSFGSEHQVVAELGAAFARGLAAEKILACAKHFPGHGDTLVDPHESFPVFEGTLERLKKMELVPFEKAIVTGVPSIMTAHILLPKLDSRLPATLSPKILTNLLRETMKFEGVILADDLGMGALTKWVEPAKAAEQTFLAGSDLAMLCHDWSLVGATLLHATVALEAGSFPSAQWATSRARIQALQAHAENARFEAPPLAVVGCGEHRALANEIRGALLDMD